VARILARVMRQDSLAVIGLTRNSARAKELAPDVNVFGTD
jgi:hypothetical protein